MWLLECSDKNTLGSRMWLRPGTRTVLGRMKQGDVTLTVPSWRSISRSHLAIHVAPVNEEDGVKILTRSRVTVEDLSTKHGTTVDGQSIQGTSIVLDGVAHSLVLGKHQDHPFWLTWCPVVFSFSLKSRDRKDKNVMAPHRNKVEALDIKTVPTWTDATTHVVAYKRNTAIGLQALVNGRLIVTATYLDAIVKAATLPPVQENERAMSPLELDFDKHWPNAEEFLPPAGSEPGPKSAEMFRPNPRRKTLFEGWTFVFCEDIQYQNLLGVITAAHGKAEYFNLKLGETKPEELVDFARKRAGLGGVALVKFNSRINEEWEADFVRRTEQLLGFKLLVQNEFLDTILNCDTSTLCKPLGNSPGMLGNSPATQGGAASAPQSIPAPPKQEPTSKPTETTSGAPVPTSTPARRGRIRRRGAIHIVDEDDDFLPAPTQRRPSSPQPAPMEEVVEEETEPALPVQPPAWRSHVPAESKKRRAPTPPPIDDKDSMLDLMDFLPGSRIVKRRKMAEAEERARQEELGQVAEPEPEPMSEVEIVKVEKVEKPVKAAARGKKALVKPETPYETYVREMREKEEEQALKEEKLAMEGIDVNGLRNLAIVETFKVQPRGSRPVRGSFGSKGAGWKPEWDGRKNFKGFVRSGGERSFGGPRKIVGLVASKGKNNRMGDGSWNEKDCSAQDRHSRIEVQVAPDSPESDDGFSLPNRRSSPRAPNPALKMPVPTASTPVISQGTKRAGPSQESRGGAAGKKQKTTFQIRSDEDSSDDSDDLKFKLRKRR